MEALAIYALIFGAIGGAFGALWNWLVALWHIMVAGPWYFVIIKFLIVGGFLAILGNQRAVLD